MVFIGDGRAKLLFAGEHAVLFGSPAVGVRLPLKTTVTATSTSSSVIKFDESFDCIRETYPAFISRATETVKDIITFGHSSGVTLNVTSNIPLGSGLGSSSALCVALTDAMKQLQLYYKPTHHIDDWHSMAQRFESIFHGNSSGIDCLLSARDTDAITIYNHSNHSVYYSITTTNQHPTNAVRLVAQSTAQLTSALPCYIAVTKRDITTKALIKNLYQSVYDTTQPVHQHMKKLININHEYATLLQTDRPTPIAILCETHNTIHQHLCALNLSTQTVDSMVHAALASGATSAKITGAGGGGAILILFDDMQRWKQGSSELYDRLHDIDRNMVLYQALLSRDNEWEIFQQVAG